MNECNKNVRVRKVIILKWDLKICFINNNNIISFDIFINIICLMFVHIIRTLTPQEHFMTSIVSGI